MVVSSAAVVVAMIVTHPSSVVIALSIVPQYSRLPRLWQQQQQQLYNNRQCTRRIELYSLNGKINNNNEYSQANIAFDDEVDRRARVAELPSSSSNDDNDNDSVPTATVKLVESWLITHLPTLSSTDLQYYATSLIADGYDTIPKLNSIHSPNVELLDPAAILFMKKAHRRVLMKKIGLVSKPTRLTPTPTTRSSATATASATAQRSSSREEDFAVNAATLRAKYMAEVAEVDKKQKEIEKHNIAIDESATPSSSTTSTTATTRDDEGETWEDVYSIMDDLSTRYITMDTTKMDGGTCGDKEERRKELIRLKELKQGLLSSSSSSSSSSTTTTNDVAVTIGNKQEEREYYYDFIEDDLSKRYSTMDHNAMLLMPNRETRDKELRRLRELNDLLPGMNKAVVASSQPSSVFIQPPRNINKNNNGLQVENDVMDDVSARYSSLDNVKMALDGGHTDKQLRRLREIKETFVQRRSRKKKSSYRDDKLDDNNASSYLSDNLTKWYDSTKGKSAVTTIVNNVNSSKKESRRLDELKKRAQELELKATRLNYLSSRNIIQDEEPLRLDLLKRKQTENDTNYDRKERMRLESLVSIIEKKKTLNTTRITELQRLVATRLSAEKNKKSSAQQSIEHPTTQLHDEYDKYRPRKSGSVGYASSSNDDGTELIYKTNEKGRLDDLEKYRNKRRGNRILATTTTTPPNGKDDDGGDDNNAQAVVSTPIPPPPINRGVRLVSDKLYGVVTELCNLDTDEEDCWDITRRPNFNTRIRNTNIDQRKSISSLSTTLPPTNRGVRIVRRDKNNNTNTNEDDMDVELCDLEQEDDDCWDITRQPNFNERTRNINVDQRKSIQSLSTTMSPSYNNDLSSETSTVVTKGTVSSVTSTTAVSSLLPDRKDKVQSDDPNVNRILSENNMNVMGSSSATTTNTIRNLPKGSAKPSLSDEDTNYHIISLFPKERPSLLVNTGTRRDFTTLGTYDDTRFISGSDRSGMKNKSRFKTRDDAPDEQYVDKPRSFQGNLELTSNMSGRRFKTSSDLRYKRNNADVWLMSDIDGMAMTQRSKIVPSSSSFQPTYSSELDSMVPTSRKNYTSIDNYTGEEKLMHWLLTHLPNIEEDDAVQYFNCLVEDGFDSIDVKEILEEDLSFMKSIHKQALLQSLKRVGEREQT
jgi:hypothetical protein